MRSFPAPSVYRCKSLRDEQIIINRGWDLKDFVGARSAGDQAEQLLREYCAELGELYGPTVLRPNHHYATHIAQSVRDYGPLHEFWTFLFERLNKVLKSYKTSNHTGGELEVLFFREFHRTVQESQLLSNAFSYTAFPELQTACTAMLRASADDRGTVQLFVREVDEAQTDSKYGVYLRLSPGSEIVVIEKTLYYHILEYLQTREPGCWHSHLILAPNPGSRPLLPSATFFDHVIVHNQCFNALHQSTGVTNCLVAVQSSSTPGGFHVGELLDILAIPTGRSESNLLAHVQWFVPADCSFVDTFWETYATASVQMWKANEYLSASDPGPPALIPLEKMICYAIRLLIPNWAGHQIWATVLRQCI
ncbi:hypothetical protein NP233_g9374 [Leucocoprinus birnbaumii]|uniref:Uncharacterized protein n=1 Tax=Leucocoprinus birnbaumii TaxID=56174 RepID=A0AAD5YSX3_9AGAR|nr:hypothetical protein NP233_g9374 [Leucocoprinus birnbaumii]